MKSRWDKFHHEKGLMTFLECGGKRSATPFWLGRLMVENE